MGDNAAGGDANSQKVKPSKAHPIKESSRVAGGGVESPGADPLRAQVNKTGAKINEPNQLFAHHNCHCLKN